MTQLQSSQREPSALSKDLLAIRMAAINPILDPWIYILLRKTVVLKLVEKIKCLFCKMGGRGRENGRRFRCADGHFSSINSQDCPSLMTHELQDMMNTSQTFLCSTEGNHKGTFQRGSQSSCCSPAAWMLQGCQGDEASKRGFSQSDLEDAVPGGPRCPEDSALCVTSNVQEKCIRGERHDSDGKD